MPGTLALSRDRRPTLMVVGSIDPSTDAGAWIGTRLGLPHRVPRVVGRTSTGKPVTLTDVNIGLHEMHIEDPASAVFRLEGRVAFVGGHIDSRSARFARSDGCSSGSPTGCLLRASSSGLNRPFDQRTLKSQRPFQRSCARASPAAWLRSFRPYRRPETCTGWPASRAARRSGSRSTIRSVLQSGSTDFSVR